MTALRWGLRIGGVVLILLTVGTAAAARFGGTEVGDEGLRLGGGAHYLVASGGVAHCAVSRSRLDIPPLGPREILDGARIEPAAGARLSCTGGDVRVTSGPMLALYPLAEYDFLPIIGGALLIVVPRFLRPRDRQKE